MSFEQLFKLPEQKPPENLKKSIDDFIQASYNSADVCAMNIVEYLLKKRYLSMTAIALMLRTHKATNLPNIELKNT